MGPPNGAANRCGAETSWRASDTKPIKIKNANKPTGAAVLIQDIGLTGNFTQTNTCGTILPPHGKCQINVKFAPSVTGSQNGAVMITDNVLGRTSVRVNLTGAGK